jgi:gas vesicle protein
MIMKEELIAKRIPILTSFLVGSAVGAGLAFLLAPKPGKEIREDIKRFTTSTKDRVTDKVNVAVARGKEIYEEGKATVAGAIEAGKTTYVQAKENWPHAS